MAITKILLIGAGSTSFGVSTLADLFQHAEYLRDSTLALCDVNTQKLSHVTQLAERMNAASGAPFVIESAPDFRDLADGARFVLVSVEVDRLERWQLDWQIPLRHGIRHVLGENGGPGGLSHALRTIPLVLGIAQEVERRAPGAFLINLTNPLPRVCLALTRYTRLNVIGMCHQINKGYYVVARVLGLTPELNAHFPPAELVRTLKAQIDLQTVGLNHFTWITAMRERGTGRDLYPEFRARLDEMGAEFEPLSRRLHSAFGLFPTSGDGHLGEYLAYAHETSDLTGYDFAGRAAHSRELDAQVARAAADGAGLDAFLRWESGERAVALVAAIAANLNAYEQTVNVCNNGALPGLPDWAIVETPALVGAGGAVPLRHPPLPPGITALLQQQAAIQDRTVEAAVHGDRRAAMQALLLDPLIASHTVAERVLDDLLAAHADVLPAFGRANSLPRQERV